MENLLPTTSPEMNYFSSSSVESVNYPSSQWYEVDALHTTMAEELAR